MFELFKKKKEPKNLNEAVRLVKKLENDIEKLSQRFSDLEKKNKLSIQKIEIMRYNPFSNTGGNQSFSIALLDDNDDGLIITSIYSKDGNRVYSKPVKKGKSEFELSDEEKKVIEQAQRNKYD